MAQEEVENAALDEAGGRRTRRATGPGSVVLAVHNLGGVLDVDCRRAQGGTATPDRLTLCVANSELGVRPIGRGQAVWRRVGRCVREATPVRGTRMGEWGGGVTDIRVVLVVPAG